MINPAVVMDNGSGFTKIGYAGNTSPLSIFPTSCAKPVNSVGERNASPFDEHRYVVGEDCASYPSWQLKSPMKHGVVEDWDAMELFWNYCFYEKLRCNPDEHKLLMTEAPLNPPENREQTAEIMFETFGVSGLLISVQAILAIAASWTSIKSNHKEFSGLVVDSGEGATHIVPVADGHILASGVRQIPVGGSDISNFVLQSLRQRKEPIPPQQSLETARKIKKRYLYVCSDIQRETDKYLGDRQKYVKQYSGFHAPTNQSWQCSIETERFLAPEIMFRTDIETNFKTKSFSLPQVIDDVIQQCPIDVRKNLYSNIVLSGGNTVFKGFEKRVQRDVDQIVQSRIEQSASKITTSLPKDNSSTKGIGVNVVNHKLQEFAVWFGGSMLASTEQFNKICFTKEQYAEEGTRIFRKNVAFNADI